MITLVGQPRSGTSMMMRVLEMGGIPIEYEQFRTNEQELREKYRNFYGFYDVRQPSFTKCFKCVRPELVGLIPKDWKIIYIERTLESVKNSFIALNEKNADTITEKIMDIRKKLKEGIEGREILSLDYDSVQQHPEDAMESIAKFVAPIPFNKEEALKAIDKELYIDRNKQGVSEASYIFKKSNLSNMKGI
jgi:hypothetical protein